MSEMTPEWLSKIRERVDCATPGRWKVWGCKVLADVRDDSDIDHAVPVANTFFKDSNGHPRTNNADFIACARTDVPALLKYIKELEAQLLIEHSVDHIHGQIAGLRWVGERMVQNVWVFEEADRLEATLKP